MRKLVFYFFILSIVSCRNYQSIEGRIHPVYFTADSTVFADTLAELPTVNYPELSGLTRLSHLVELQKGRTTTDFIHEPTFIRQNQDVFLIYPGEHLVVHQENDRNLLLSQEGNPARDNELLLLNRFRDLERWPRFPFQFDGNLQWILDLEQGLKQKIGDAQTRAYLLYDSLCQAYAISKEFKAAASGFIRRRYEIDLLMLNEMYRDTLSAHGLYRSRLKSFLPDLNRLDDIDQFNENTQYLVNQLYADLFPGQGIWSMGDETEFRSNFDSVEVNFAGLPRDYLLSRIMYRAILKKFKIPASYRRKYRHYTVTGKYRKMIGRARKKQRHEEHDHRPRTNALLAADGNATTFEDLIARHKGRYILIDLWASWCLPCLKETPALQQLAQKYPREKIVFLSISTDKDSVVWHQTLQKLRCDNTTNYLLLEKDRAPLIKQIQLSTIPRYLLYDRQGRLVNADTPVPSDPELVRIIDACLKE